MMIHVSHYYFPTIRNSFCVCVFVFSGRKMRTEVSVDRKRGRSHLLLLSAVEDDVIEKKTVSFS